MKRLLIICILIVSVIFISGCTSEEKTETPMSSQNSQESDTESTGSILKSSDVSGYTSSGHRFLSVKKNALYVPEPERNSNALIPVGWDSRSGAVEYTDTLRMGYRNVGEEIWWRTESGKGLMVSVNKFDSDPDSSLIELFNELKEKSERASEVLNSAQLDIMDIGDPKIGDYSYYFATIDTTTDIQHTKLYFIHGNTGVTVDAIDEKGISKSTAIRVAKIIEDRLD